MVDEAIAAGAKKVTRDFQLPGEAFVAPALLVDVPGHVTLAREEIFGPVAGIFSFRTETEVLARLQHVMVSPATIGGAAKSVLVLMQSGHKMIS